ncbi:uncharacterized protein [Diabrotica undecimpunctata]|uniref:uncharacterized protein n=1 Tax=Diabrotica undecimpunctata TaxID=50387 RepID=UPI003B640D20
MGDQVDFATRFHNLDGDLKGERSKSLFKLLKTTIFENEAQLENVLKSLKPKSYQENLFYIDTLIYYKRSNDLIEILKGGNDVYISKILKQVWFFQNIFDDIEAETFVTEFLPHLSYAVKKKFLKRVSNHWNEQKIDSLFEALQKKYGLPLAVMILHKCSPTKIKTVIIVEYDLKLNSNQVLNIYNKSEELFMFYLKHYFNSNKGKYNDEKVLKHIATKNPKLLLKLQREENILIYGIGKRTSKNIFNVANDDIIKDTDYYLRFLKNSIVIRKLGKNFETLFKNLFPNTLNSVSIYCRSCMLLTYYPKNRRWNLFNQTFIEKFNGRDLKDLLLNFNSMMKLNPPKEIIELWAEVNYKEQKGDYNNFLKYYPPSKAIPILKEKVNVTSDINGRLSLVRLMIEACSNSKDLDSLVEVLKYVCFRHRNEETTFRKQVLGSVRNNFNLEDLNENHWKYIDEQIHILRIQKKLYLKENGDFIEKHLEYLVKNGKDYKSLLIDYFKDMVIEGHSIHYSYKDLSLRKRLYIEMIELLDDVIKSVQGNTDNKHFKLDFLQTILKFCQENPEYCIKIADFPVFVQLIHESFSKNSNFDNQIIVNVILYNVKFPQYAVEYNRDIFQLMREAIEENKSLGPFGTLFSKILFTKDRDDFANKLLKFYCENFFERFPDSSIIGWFLKNEPKVLLPYIAIVALNTKCVDRYKMYKLIKHYSHLGFDKAVSDYLIARLDSGNIDISRLILIKISILLSTDDFITFVSERYLPKKDKLDLMDDEMRKIYQTQCDVAKLLGYVNEPYKMLPTIMKFCRGDYLQSVLPSLQKSFYRSPERILYSYVEALSKQAVSARKHAIFFSCEVLDKQHALHVLTNTKESNVSSLKYLFSATLKYFLKNPSEELLDKVIESMNNIDVNDKETLDSLKDVTIPVKYRAQYIEKCWKYFEGLKSKDVKITDYLNSFLNHMSADILSILSVSFTTHIINRYFPVVDERLDDIDDFVVRVLRTRIPERNRNFQIVFDMLSKFLNTMRISFFKSFIDSINNEPDQQFLAMFAENWYKNFSLIDSFDEHIILNLISFKLENSSVDDLATKTVNYLEQLIAEFGYHCFDRFNDKFKSAFNYLYVVEEYSLYLAILKYKATPTTCSLVLNNVIDMSDDDDEKLRNIFNEIINIIKNVETPIVRVNLKSFLDDNQVNQFVAKKRKGAKRFRRC